jgi:hypothetical protein
MKNRSFYFILLVLAICMFLAGCSVETVDEYNSRMKLTQDIEGTNSISVKAEHSETVIEKATSHNAAISQEAVSVSDSITQRLESVPTVQAADEPEKPVQTNVETAPPALTTQETDKKVIKVKIGIYCNKAVVNWDKLNESAKKIVPESGVILDIQDYNAEEGDTVFDVLKGVCESNGISLSYTGSVKRKNIYINGINGLYERDCGGASGWVYSVNDEFIIASAGGYVVKDGDMIEFHFTDGSRVF